MVRFVFTGETMTEQFNEPDNSEKSDPMIGARLGDYTVYALIGRGGMARVYEGLDEKLGRKAAIKVISVEHDQNDEMTQRFIREARAAANLDHPNIVSVYQFGESGSGYYMAMKLAFLESDKIVSIVTQISSALDYAHSKNVIHRDIKPSNIMLTEDDRAILTDFGLTMTLGSETTLGTAFGTPRYIAPEQAIASHQAGPQSDIYSLGVVLYEMATGQAPFDSDSPMSLALSHITNPPPPPQSVRPDLSHPVQLVILKALEKRPENRWKTATAMADALRKAYKGIEPDVVITKEELDVTPGIRAVLPTSDVENTTFVPSGAVVKPVQERPRGGRRVLRTVLALLLIAALIGAAIVATSRAGVGTSFAAFTSASPTPANRMRLIYSKDSFYVYNSTGALVSLEGISFVRNDQTSLAFDAARFGDRTFRNFAAGQCLLIAPRTADGTNNPDLCKTPAKIWPYEDPSFIFWAMKSDKDPVDTFLVTKDKTPIQTCSMRVNTCEFVLS